MKVSIGNGVVRMTGRVCDSAEPVDCINIYAKVESLPMRMTGEDVVMGVTAAKDSTYIATNGKT